MSNGNGHPYELTHPFWCGRLAQGVTRAIIDLRSKQEHVAREHLEALLKDFLASPVPSGELKRDLREQLKAKR